MKLHLPKQLFTALLTAITLAAAPAALTLGSAAWGAWTATNTYTLDEGDNEIKLSEGTGDASGSVAGIVFVKPDDASDEAGSITSITFDNDTAKQLVITGDWDGAFNFTGLTVGTLNVNVGGATLNIGGNQASNASQVVTINGMSGSNSLSSVTVKAGSSLTLDGNNTTYTGVTTVEAGATLTIKHTKALGSWHNMTASDVLGRVEGAGTLVIDFTDSNPDNIDVAAKGSGDGSSLGGFTGVVDIQRGKLYIGNNPSQLGNGNNAGDFGASKVIVRNGAEFWTHSNSAELTTPQIDLMSGATLGNKDGNKEYTGNIRFNVVNPYATGDAVQYDENGVACISAHWGKELKYSGLLEGDGTVKFLNTIHTGSGGSDWRVNYYLLNKENKFSGTYELADNEECKEGNNDNDEIRLYLENSGVAQYASINLSSTKATSKLILGADSTIVNLNGSVAKNLVTTKDGVSATLTVSGGSFAGMLQNGANNGILSLTKTGAGTLTLSGTNTYTGTTSVQGGELILTSASALGSGNISVAEGAALTLNTNSTIQLSTAERISGAGTVHIMDGTTLVMSHSSGTAAVKGSTIHVHGGGILNLNSKDRLGWGSNATGAILLKGESDTKLATLQLGGRQTMATSLLMQGNALVESTGGTGSDVGGLNPLKASGVQITATGKNNIINATLHRRDAFLFEVTGADDELEVQGNVVSHAGGISGGYDGSPYEAGSIVKDGAGKLTFSGSGNTFDKKYLHKAGTSVMSGTANFTSTVEIQSGKFETSGTTTMSGAITNNGVVAVSGGSATLSGAVTNNGAITVSGGSATLSGAVTNNGAITVSGGSATLSGTVANSGDITVSGGTANFTNTLDMGAGSSLSVSGGSATVSGALNVTGTGVQIGQSGTGVLDITGQVSVAEGAALTMGGTITLNHTITNDGTLTLNGAIYLTGDITSGFVEETAGGVTYSGTLEGQEETYNGFKTISGATYKLTQSSDGVSGTVTNTLGGNFATDSAGKTVVYHGVDEYEVTSKDGQLYFSTGTITGTEYYITTDEVVVDDAVRAVATGYTLQGGIMKLQGGSVATSNITYTSGSVALSDAATLIIDVVDNTETATHWLTNTTGDASTSIEIAANANFGEVSSSPSDAKYTTSFSGKWVVCNGATLKLGGLDSGQNNAYVVNLLSLESLDLDGGNLRFFGDSGKLGQVNVKQNARFDIYEMYDDDSLLNIEKLNLEANLTMATDWRSQVNIAALTGSGSFVIESGRTYSTFKANVTDEYTGVFDLNHAADMMYVELNVAKNATATIEGDSDTSINKLTLKKGASFNIDTNGGSNLGFTYSLGSVDIEDSATIQTTQAHGGWQAEVNIGSLTGNADAVLNIISNTYTSQRSIINLNGGNFDGTVNVTGSSGGGDRKIALNVNDSTVLADAVVSMHGNGSHVALAIGGTEGNSVTLKGINDQENANGTIVIVSGAQNYDTNANFLSANEYDSHTLVIDTDGSGESDPNATGGTYSTKATISAGLNLQKEGNGKQTFSGDFSRFDGSVTVNGGTLEITTADTSSKSWGITTATVNQGASLHLGGTVTVGSMSAAGSIALDADSTLTLGGGTADAQKQHSIGTLTGGAGSTLNLAQHSVLNKVNTISVTVTLTGSGMYNYGSYTADSAFAPGFTLDANNWTGKVALTTGGSGIQLTHLKNASTANSKLQLTGFKGYLDGTDHTMSNNLILVNGDNGYGLLLDNGSWNASPTVNFTGSIEGTGNLVYAWKNTDGSAVATHVISGNTSAWEGKFVRDLTHGSGDSNKVGKDVVVKFTAGGDVFADTDTSGVEDAQNTGKLSVVIEAQKDTNFRGAITDVGSVEVKSNTAFNRDVTTGSATVDSDVTAKVNSTLTAGTVTNSGQIKLGEAATVTGGSMSKVQMSSTGITGTAQDGSSSIANADIEIAQLAQDASFTIQDMTLTNTSITAASVNIAASKVSGNVVLNVVKPTEAITAPNVGQGGTGGEISFSYGLALVDSSSSLTLNMEVPQAILPSESGLYTLTITLNGFAEGFDFSNIDSQVVFGADSWLGQALTGASTSVTVDGNTISAGAAAAQSSGAPSVSYNATGSNVGSLVITITGLNVPEPTTSTLSLLALAALAARRRRK